MVQPTLAETEVAAVVRQLSAAGQLKITEGKVSCTLSPAWPAKGVRTVRIA
jgi:hypothetical protein